MDRTKYEAAHQLYQEKDYRKAARLFLEAADEGTPLENGMAYHGAGNSFMCLKRYHDAIIVYEQALRDDSYQKRGTIENNLANAYLQNGDLSQAIAHFEAALDESSMYEPYKCYQGLAHAYFEQRAYEQAALAYKNAALDERNPNPGAALVNLGLCMMALERPESAVEAYSAALGVDGYANRGKALANLGMAYYACKDYTRAQRALEEAQVMHHYQLNPAATEVLAACQAMQGQGQTPEEAAGAAGEEGAVVAAEGGAGSLPEEAPVAAAASAAEPEPAPIAASTPAPAPAAQPSPEEESKLAALEAQQQEASVANPVEDHSQDTGQIGPLEEVDSFYALSDKEIARQRKQELRRGRSIWHWLAPVLIVLGVLLILAGAAVAVFTTGFGAPSVDTTIAHLFSAYNTGVSYESYWVSGTPNIGRQMKALPPDSDFSIKSIDPQMTSSTAKVAVTAPGSTNLNFTVTLKRVGLGWKISSIKGDY